MNKVDKRADLHVHTQLSDGTFSPSKVVDYAVKNGLAAIAVTDHDCVDGIAPATEAAKGKPIEIIPGIELTSETNGCEVHILGYFIRWKEKWLIDKLNYLCEERITRMRKMLKMLAEYGVKIEFDEVANIGGEGSLGRLHLAKALLDNGYVKNTKEAFAKYIGNNRPCYIKGGRLDSKEAIAIVRRAGGIAVYAHPGVMGEDEFIADFVKAGLKGIEAYHSDQTDKAARRYLETAKEFGLVATGGSDCHGHGKGKVLMGTVTVPYRVVEELRRMEETGSKK